ncbi:MAG: anaerobic ribonucleoside-triphosphate reductase activating protein [Halanaerobium sp.]
MKIAGLRKTSLIDFPERISSVVFTAGCNFYCSYCHNSQLLSLEDLAEAQMLSEEQFYNFLADRKKLIDGVTITGGEPTLQTDLKDFIEKIRSDYGLQIKLDTNGSRPFVLKELLEQNLIDYLAMDIKMSWAKYSLLAPADLITGVKESLKIVLASELDYELRTTVVPGLHDKAEIEKIAAAAGGAERYFIQNFRPLNTLDPNLKEERQFSPSELKSFKKAAEKYIENVHIRD